MRRPRLWTVLLAGNLVLLALPLTGVWMLRIYESALIRQTESELIAQAAMLAATFRAGWLGNGGMERLDAMPKVKSESELSVHAPGQRTWPPLTAVLDLADDPILPAPGEAAPTSQAPDAAAKAAGAQLLTVLRETQTLTLAAIRVVDAGGIVVASTAGEIGQSLMAQHEVAAALAGAAVSTLRTRTIEGEKPSLDSISRTSTRRVFFALPAVESGRVLGAVMLSRTPRSIGQTLYGKRYQLGMLALILLGGGALVAWVTALAVSRPVRAVMLQAHRAAGGERGAVTPLASPMTREIAALSASIASMAATLEQRADYIRGFAAEISHEFKTPLASLHGTIELLRDHLATMSEAERQRFLDNLQGDVDRLNRLVQRLLDLARADMRQRTGAERTDLSKALPSLAARCREQGLDMTAEGPATTMFAAIDPDSLETALGNLAENVRVHADGASATLSWRHDKATTVIRLADTGPGISPGNAARVFDRFFTTARDRGGTGLGLAIVRSQLASFGGTIALLPGTRGATFEITLPRAES